MTIYCFARETGTQKKKAHCSKYQIMRAKFTYNARKSCNLHPFLDALLITVFDRKGCLSSIL